MKKYKKFLVYVTIVSLWAPTLRGMERPEEVSGELESQICLLGEAARLSYNWHHTGDQNDIKRCVQRELPDRDYEYLHFEAPPVEEDYSGLFSIALVNHEKRRVLISHRGTQADENSLNLANLRADLGLAYVTQPPSQGLNFEKYLDGHYEKWQEEFRKLGGKLEKESIVNKLAKVSLKGAHFLNWISYPECVQRIKVGARNSARFHVKVRQMLISHLMSREGSKKEYSDIKAKLEKLHERLSSVVSDAFPSWCQEVFDPFDHLSGYEFWVTGHSLGGFYAQLMGRLFNLKTVSFNAPGASEFCEDLRWGGRHQSASHIINCFRENDIVGTLGTHVGLELIYPSYENKANIVTYLLDNHKMDPFLRELKKGMPPRSPTLSLREMALILFPKTKKRLTQASPEETVLEKEQYHTYALKNIEEARRHGEDSEKKRHYHQALDWLKKAADQGHVPATLQLGMTYYYGMQGQEVDSHRGIDYFFKAADTGNDPVAQCQLAMIYAEGNKSHTADEYFLKGLRNCEMYAQNGNMYARFCLGKLYFLGLGQKKDEIKGLQYLCQASQQGDSLSQRLLGIIYMEFPHFRKTIQEFRGGRGTSDTDLQPGLDLLVQALKEGDSFAAKYLSVLCKEGKHSAHQIKKIKKALSQASQGGCKMAQHLLDGHPLTAQRKESKKEKEVNGQGLVQLQKTQVQEMDCFLGNGIKNSLLEYEKRKNFEEKSRTETKLAYEKSNILNDMQAKALREEGAKQERQRILKSAAAGVGSGIGTAALIAGGAKGAAFLAAGGAAAGGAATAAAGGAAVAGTASTAIAGTATAGAAVGGSATMGAALVAFACTPLGIVTIGGGLVVGVGVCIWWYCSSKK